MSLFATKPLERIAAAMEQRLDSGRFVRVRRTAIVNLDGSRRCSRGSATSTCWC